MTVRSLRLELCLDDVERARQYAADESGACACTDDTNDIEPYSEVIERRRSPYRKTSTCNHVSLSQRGELLEGERTTHSVPIR